MRRRTLIRDRDTALEFAVDAYVYLYPLVLLDLTRRRMTEGVGVGRGPPNTFAHVAGTLPATFRDLVRPSFDVLQSFAWLDLTSEPVIVSVPDAGDGYYLLPLIDMWSDIVAAPGTRTSGNWPADYAVVPRGWAGELPARLRRIDSPTPYVWIACRLRADDRGGGDGFQRGLEITPLSRFGHGPTRHRLRLVRRRSGGVAGSVTPAVEQVDAMNPLDFFARGAELLRQHPPHVHDHAVLQRIERIGVVPGEPFDIRLLPGAVVEVLPAAVARARHAVHRRLHRLGWARNGWQVCAGTMGTWGTDYLKRATVARYFPGAVMPEDLVLAAAFGDGSGRALDGGHAYTLRFGAHEHPPVRALWSLTAYDENGYAVANDAERYAVASDDGLERAADDSLELAIQHRPPVRGPAANWLPCPPGRFNLCLRLYGPEPEALEEWPLPPVRRRDDGALRRGPPPGQAVAGVELPAVASERV